MRSKFCLQHLWQGVSLLNQSPPTLSQTFPRRAPHRRRIGSSSWSSSGVRRPRSQIERVRFCRWGNSSVLLTRTSQKRRRIWNARRTRRRRRNGADNFRVTWATIRRRWRCRHGRSPRWDSSTETTKNDDRGRSSFEFDCHQEVPNPFEENSYGKRWLRQFGWKR